MRHKKIYTVLLFACLLFSYSAVAEQAMRVSPPDEWKNCDYDAECTRFKTACTHCSEGNADYLAYNVKWKTAFQKLRDATCTPSPADNDSGDAMKMMEPQAEEACMTNIAPTGRPKCINGLCQIVE